MLKTYLTHVVNGCSNDDEPVGEQVEPMGRKFHGTRQHDALVGLL